MNGSDILVILLSGGLATAIMTAFSYVLANIQSEQFREPELLNSLISRSETIKLNPSKNHLVGWLLHFIIGWIFAAIYFLICAFTPVETGIISGSVFGLIAGVAGIIGWKIMFKLNNNPPNIDFSRFYIQLVIAHVIFGAVAALVFSWFD